MRHRRPGAICTVSLIVLCSSLALSQVSSIPAGSLLPDQQVMDFESFPEGLVSGTDPIFIAFGINLVSLVGTHTAGGDTLSSGGMGKALVSQNNQLAITTSGAMDNQGPGAGWRFEMAFAITQTGFLVVDQTNHQMRIEVFAGAVSLGFLDWTMSGGFPNPHVYFESAVPFDTFEVTTPPGAGGWGLDNLTIAGLQLGPSCTINAPAGGATVTGIVTVDHDADHLTPGTPVDLTFEWSTDSGTSWNPCTAAGASVNPTLGVVTPALAQTFDWDSHADGIGLAAPETADLRITADDGTDTSYCYASALQVDNVAPPPTCTLTLITPSPARNVVDLELVPDSVNGPTVDATLEFTTDGGATWTMATPGPAGSNPLIGLPITVTAPCTWDSRGDGVGLATPALGVIVQATLTDGVAVVPGTCVTAPFDVDNTSLCPGTCGDCDLNTIAVTVLDALVGAQISAGIATPSLGQTGCCDVNSDTNITIIDALLMAQDAAGLAPGLTCP